MRKDWLGVGLAALLLAACSSEDQQQTAAPAQQVYNGPVIDIPGAEPKYEPLNPSTSQDYSVNGKTYHIIRHPDNYSETGLATWYGDEASGNRTATGETFDPDAFTAAHPTLPLPSYVRVTNLANDRQVVVRVNDRGPYTAGRVIDLSEGAARRLNISGNSRVRLDYIKVAPDGTLSGPGTLGTRVIKQSFALPPRPEIGASSATPADATPASDAAISHPPAAQSLSSQTEQGNDNGQSLAHSGGLLGAPQPLPPGVLEGSENQSIATARHSLPPASRSTTMPASNGHYVVQVGALSDPARAQQWLQSLSKRFGVPGKVNHQGAVYRVQLGDFRSRQQASALQQRLLQEANQSSFITQASAG
ncbi:rare lipoprotein A [Erwinia sp. OLTSP20]|uniref:endolytic peptidoglycan transglycosylase RlpA n=1 Tax=unclassified Erwinia TaxID=2622719 RepID=UPI000C177832|nr:MULTISPECIES: endolytic peptidoglycan transglycosylase RlpA [unclassified Erwinia]PIJ48801.1 rare lipoprotein A [Erwinia sp. OAMSP11]PIJ69425.1 rare lipoprotein A [Erwinia sp. OLSSP12]PIJ79259.1 rare lipoprotein A [Erwinia sp. OLCASP19]PIJ80785.1 rare lipoprotein A [Erwinia sp. OLMTSP26]PIJ82937.1 rare lipoprotein A [Erwinia sp. OLMDSP33]